MTTPKILVIEDEKKIARFLELELQYEGYNVELAYDGRTGLDLAQQNDFALIILDIMLPCLNGMEVCRKLRQSSQIPIIMLTAKDQTMDKVMGLDLGADDYMTKPFAIEELLARVRMILKRRVPSEKTASTIEINKLKLNFAKHLVSYDNINIDLTKREFDLLKYLMVNKSIVLTRDKILEKVWGYDYLGDTNVVDVYIRYLRSKLDEKFNVKLIHTIRGVGYLLGDE